MRTPIVTSTLLAVLAVCASASGQDVDAAGDTAELSTILHEADLRSWRVRAVLVDDVSVDGRVQWRGEGIATIGTRRLGLTEIDRLDRRVRAGGGALKGFLIGSGVTAVGLYTFVSRGGGGFAGTGGLALGLSYSVLIGGSAGAVIGSAVGAEVKWVPLWP